MSADNSSLAQERSAPSGSVEQWRPIETAPKDGTRFLGATYFSTGPKGITDPWRYAVTWWDERFESAGWDHDKSDVLYRAAFNAGRVGSWAYEEYMEETPSHWMPLPAAPEPKQ